MRYVFTFIGVMIVLRTFFWLAKDRRLNHRRLRQLPDAGTIGILTVIRGNKQLKEGAVIPVPHMGVIGYLRTCDIVIPAEGVAEVHADFDFVDGKGLCIHPYRGCEATVDGYPLRTQRDGRHHPMQHGSLLEIGEAVMQLGIFAGLDVEEIRIEPYYEDPEPMPEPFWEPQPDVPPTVPEQPWQGYPPQPPMTRPSQGVPVPPPPHQPFWQQGGDADEP